MADTPDYQAKDLMVTDAGRFLMRRHLGSGGVSDVYLAEDVSLRKTFVVKTMRRRFFARDDLKERFLREARAIVKLEDCVYVIKVQRVGWTKDGMPFFAMDYVRGESLREILDKRSPLKPNVALNIGSDLFMGLYHAHKAGIVHRDIKPENIFIDRDNEIAKILDFGVMTLGRISHHLTGSGFVGTPIYASPEQSKSAKDVDEKTDVFSAGIVIFEMLTGHHPFSHRNATSTKDVLEAIRNGSARRLREFGDFPRVLDNLVYSMLAREPKRRAGDAKRLAFALRQVHIDHYSSFQKKVFSSTSKASSQVEAEVKPTPLTEADLQSLSPPAAIVAAEARRRIHQQQPTVDLRKGRPMTHTVSADDPLADQKAAARLIEDLLLPTEPSPMPAFLQDGTPGAAVGRFGGYRSMLAVAAIALVVMGASLAVRAGYVRFGQSAEAQPAATTRP